MYIFAIIYVCWFLAINSNIFDHFITFWLWKIASSYEGIRWGAQSNEESHERRER